MEKCFNKLTEVNKLLVMLHLHKDKENLGSLQHLGVEVFATTFDSSYSLTVAVGTSVWGVAGVLFPWGRSLVLSFLDI